MKKLLLACMMALGIGASAQWTENFDADTTLPAGWAVVNQGDPNGWVFGPPASGAAQSGGNIASIMYGSVAHDDYLITKAIPVVAGSSDRLSFYIKSRAGSFLENYDIRLSTTNQTAAAFTTVLQATQKAPAAWTKLSFNLSAYVGQTVYVAIHATDTDQFELYADTFVNDALPSCLEPTALTLTNTTTSSATVSWAAPAVAPAGGYDIYYSTTSTAPTATTAPSMNVSGTTATISGLTANTAYYIWVRSHCSTTLQSDWTASVSAYTGYCVPSASAFYFIDQFTSSGTGTNINYTATAGDPSGYRDLTATLKISNYAGSVTPITLSANDPYDAGFAVWVDWNDNLVFENSEKMYTTSSYVVTTSGASITVPTGTAIGNHRARVQMNYLSSLPTNPCATGFGGETIDLTFEVTPTPSCVPPLLSVSNVTNNAATVNWTAQTPAPANGYSVYYSTTNTAPTATTTPNMTGVTGTSVNLTGLTPTTTYYVWVKANCSATDQSIWSAATFTTPAVPPANDNCSAPTPLTVGSTFAQHAVTATDVGATLTTDATAVHACQTNPIYKDVWFSVVVPASGNVTIETNSVAGSAYTDTVMGIYSGTCGALVAVGCDEDASADGDFSLINVTNQTPGSTLLVAIWNFSNTNSGQFQISAYDTTSLGTSEVVAAKASEKVYPNPFTDFVDISDVKGAVSAMVIDASGKMVASFAKADSRLDLSKLNAGLYILSVTKKDGTVSTFKIIKK